MTDVVAALARKWCESHDQARASAHAAPCICAQLAAAIREALEEAEKAIVARFRAYNPRWAMEVLSPSPRCGGEKWAIR